MIEKLKVMKGKEIVEDDLGPVLLIAKIIIFPVLLGFLFYGAQQIKVAQYLAFFIFAGLGFFEWRTKK